MTQISGYLPITAINFHFSMFLFQFDVITNLCSKKMIRFYNNKFRLNLFLKSISDKVIYLKKKL